MNKQHNLIGLAMLAAGVMFAGGCSGDDVGGTDTPDTEVVADSGDDAGDTGGDSTPDGGEDTDTAAEPDAGDADVPDADEPAADVDPGPDEDDYPPVECAYPSDDETCPDGPFGPGTYFSKFEIVTDKTCCADIDGDDSIDNYLGNDVVGTLGPLLGGDVNGNIQLAIDNGLLMYLMEAQSWGNTAYDASLDLKVLEGDYSEETPQTNLSGEGSVYVSAESYDEDGAPRFGFGSARVDEGGVLRASGGSLNARFPGMIEAIDLELTDVSIRAQVVEDPQANLQAGGGFALVDGELSGVLMRDRFFESMNEAALECECIQNTPLLFTYVGTGTNDRYQCSLASSDAQNCSSASAACRTLADNTLCGGLAGLSGLADIETDEGRAFSIGVRFETVPTELLEVP